MKEMKKRSDSEKCTCAETNGAPSGTGRTFGFERHGGFVSNLTGVKLFVGCVEKCVLKRIAKEQKRRRSFNIQLSLEKKSIR